jgi:RNA polymerase sigma-70 factor (ECF subfamily)
VQAVLVKEEIRSTDELELARARSGDVDAFVALLARYDTSHRRLAFRLLGDRERMDDALQEAYARAFRALRSFRGRSALGTWLYRIVYNACLDELRRASGRREVPLAEWHGGEERGPAEAVAERLDLAGALASLPIELRAVTLLVDAEGLSYEEAGEVLAVPAGTVASRLNRARATLRASLAPATREGAGS